MLLIIPAMLLSLLLKCHVVWAQADASNSTTTEATSSPISQDTNHSNTVLEGALDDHIVDHYDVKGPNKFVVFPFDRCRFYFTFCIPMSKFSDLTGFGENAESFTAEEWEDMQAAVSARMDDNLIFIPGLSTALSKGILQHWGEVRNAKVLAVTLSGSGVGVTMLAVGATVRDISEINYIGGYFTVDLRLYAQKVELGFEGAPFQSMQQALDTTWDDLNASTLLMKDLDGSTLYSDNWFKRLPREYRDDPSQLEDGFQLVQDGSCSRKALKSARLLTYNEYAEMNGKNNSVLGGIRVLWGSKQLTPVTDANNNIIYFDADEIRIKFQPINGYFYPFQINVLDIKLASPVTQIDLNQPIRQYAFCVDPSYTGLKHPLPSLPERGTINMIPSVWHTTAAPWFTAGYEHMMLADTGIHQENELQSRLFQEVMFRLVYEGDPTSPWFAILPVLFTAFIIQLQWLITKPSTCGGSTMITAVLLVQNLVSTQTKYVGYQNIANDVLTFTYVVAIVYVGAVTLMTFINVTKQYGKIEWLAKHQDIIFKYFQLLGYLLSLLYIPLLVFDRNPETGEQQKYKWLWPLVVSIAVFIFLIAMAGDLRRWRVKTKDNIKGPPPDFHHLLSCDIGTLNRDEVETWIRNHRCSCSGCTSIFEQ